MFPIQPGDPFDLTVPRNPYDADNDSGVVNNQEHQEDARTMFWGTTDQEAALRWGTRYHMRLEGRLDRVYVWEVRLEAPKFDVNAPTGGCTRAPRRGCHERDGCVRPNSGVWSFRRCRWTSSASGSAIVGHGHVAEPTLRGRASR